MNYAELIMAGSFTDGNGRRIVNSFLINTVAAMWAMNERGIDVYEKTEQSKDVYPL